MRWTPRDCRHFRRPASEAFFPLRLKNRMPPPVGALRRSPQPARSRWDCPAGTAPGHLARYWGKCCAHPPAAGASPLKDSQDGRKRPTCPRPGHGAPKPARLACGLSGRGRCGALPCFLHGTPQARTRVWPGVPTKQIREPLWGKFRVREIEQPC